MNIKRTRNWLLSAAIAMGAAGFGTSAAYAAPRDREEEVRMADIPRSVRETIDKERGNREIKHIEHVFRDGNEWYRATITQRGNKDQVIRVAEGGKLLSEESVRDGAANERNTRAIDRDRDDRSNEKQVRLASVPRDVRDVIDKERGRNEVKAVYEVNRDGRTFYRAIIDDKNGDRMLRVSENGKLLEESDIREVRTAVGNLAGDRGDRGVRRGVDDDGDHVSFDRLPGEVKTVIAREAGSDKVGDVYRYERRGRTIYEADLNSGTRTRVLKVDENGRVLSEKDDTPEGRRAVQFGDLPGAVKSGLASEVNERDINRVVQVTRDGKTFYRARVEKGGEPRWITVDERGRVSDEFNSRR